MQETGTSRKAPIIAIVIAVLAIAGLTVFALSNQRETPQTADTTSRSEAAEQTTTTDEAAPTPSERMSITYTDNGFEPADITVKKGTVITVKNESSNDVQFSSADHPTHRENAEMNLKTLSPGESDSYTASRPGTWGYHDHIDESMTGTVTVTE